MEIYKDIKEWDIGDYSDFSKACSYNPDTLTQYTGMQDNKGNDIYEGDLLDTGNSTPMGVIFRYGAFRLAYDGGNAELSYDHDMVDYEVIGNIYQNPELLNK